MQIKNMFNKSIIAFISLFLICFSLISCTTTPEAPVIERTSAKKPAPAKSSAQDKDWRPDTYTVKKGDTLYSIGLEFGYYYKDIAQANNLQPPFIIRVGQQLKFQQLKAKENKVADVAPTPNNENNNNTDDNVIIKPLNIDGAAATATSKSGEIPLLTAPKALREPYSEQAMAAVHTQAKPVAAPAKATEQPKSAETTKPDLQKADAPKTENSNKAEDDNINWGWPTNGKVIAGFNESTNAKGIDIGGTQGQAINAAGSGRVIYSGSDLRGYGKLVIIKHNKNFLSVYAHNSQIFVKEGELVSKGQKIAEMGSTDADRVKLHFEIRQQGKSVDPAKFMPNN